MNYIRTKDGRIVKVEEHMMIKETTIDGVKKCFRLVYKNRPFVCVLRGDEDYIIKQADTIEELIDEFVFTDSNNSFYQVETYNSVCGKDIVCYGAIWTGKGLIYVAKMNEKGELELI